jgi:biotin transport system substrate-specific component
MAAPLTLASAALPRSESAGRSSALLRNALLVVGFSIFVALGAQIKIPLVPVPITGQDLAVLLAGAVLGARLGGLALLTYVGEGLLGLPVYAGGANAWAPTPALGVPYILGPTAGYLVGFIAAAILVGWLAERGWDRSVPRAAVAMVIGQAVIFVCGLSWLAHFVPAAGLLTAGLLPFLPGTAIKLALAAVALPGAWSLLGRPQSHEHRS